MIPSFWESGQFINSNIIDHLVSMQAIGLMMIEHRLIEKIVPVLEKELERLNQGGVPDPLLIESAVDFFRTYADRTHHGKEEDILFRELKKKQFDPLFSVNHTFATMRAKINRLNRRTWCTTKLPERLADHIDIFIDVFCDRLKLLNTAAPRRQRNSENRTIAA